MQSNIQNSDEIFVICRSSVASSTLSEFEMELKKAIAYFKKVKETLTSEKLYFEGLARKVAFQFYSTEFHNVIEEEGVFEYLGIWDKLEKIKNGRVDLSSGFYLIFEQTSAFITIDVNSGSDLKTSKEEINLSACGEIYRVIKICGFGGKILIDFLPCSKSSRKKIYRKFVACFDQDSISNKIWGWTKSGIFEIERKRDKIPLELLIQRN